jgi:hypothetical protein
VAESLLAPVAVARPGWASARECAPPISQLKAKLNILDRLLELLLSVEEVFPLMIKPIAGVHGAGDGAEHHGDREEGNEILHGGTP